jgi:hypothetical protein
MAEWTSHTITQGDDAALVLTITKNGAVLNITGMDVRWTAVSNRGDLAPALGPYVATITNGPQGLATVSIPKADTLALDAYAYLWDAQVTDAQEHEVTVMRGLLHVLANITASPPA